VSSRETDRGFYEDWGESLRGKKRGKEGYNTRGLKRREEGWDFGRGETPSPSQTWLCYVWLMAWHIRLSVRLSSVCRLWRACTLLRVFNFLGIFLYHIVCSLAIRQLTHQKSRRSFKGITLSERVKHKGGGQTGESCISTSLLIYYSAIIIIIIIIIKFIYIQLENK